MKERFLWLPTKVDKGYERGIAWLESVYEVDGNLYTNYGLHARNKCKALSCAIERQSDEIKNDPSRKYAVYQLPINQGEPWNSITWQIKTKMDAYTGAKRHLLHVGLHLNFSRLTLEKEVSAKSITPKLMMDGLAVGGRELPQFKLWVFERLIKTGFKVVKGDL